MFGSFSPAWLQAGADSDEEEVLELEQEECLRHLLRNLAAHKARLAEMRDSIVSRRGAS